MRRARRSAELAARVGRTALGAAALLLAQSAFAQLKDVPPPPRLDPAPTVFTISPKDLSDKPKDPSTLTAAQLAATAAGLGRRTPQCSRRGPKGAGTRRRSTRSS